MRAAISAEDGLASLPEDRADVEVVEGRREGDESLPPLRVGRRRPGPEPEQTLGWNFFKRNEGMHKLHASEPEQEPEQALERNFFEPRGVAQQQHSPAMPGGPTKGEKEGS